MKKTVLVLSIILLLPCVAMAQQVKDLSPKRVYDLIREGSGLWLIDVRAPSAFSRGHIEGSLNIPAVELAAKQMPQSKILVLAGNSLGELVARKAAEQIASQGGRKVFVLAGGVRGWQLAKLPFVGSGNDFETVRVFPGELQAARQQRVALDLYDLRSELEMKQSPLDGVIVPVADTFSGKLKLLRKELGVQGEGSLFSQMKSRLTVVVLPATVRSETLYRQSLRDLPGDVRVLEGGYVAVRQGQSRKVSAGGCATCPGG
jgi:rhodanese-related sulfurtransferase